MNEPRPLPAVAVSALLAAIPGAGSVQVVFEAVEDRVRRRLASTMISVTELVGDGDTLLQRIDDLPELEDLLLRALEVAMRTSNEAKRKLLAQAVAAASRC